ncbi:LarC family nickel insertion protein [Azospirillum sp. RWY-5-1]|uniref:LarC family nickel insertion protein n=1 Tax=Azospirillum oleiclasticum TaxID=2735135 RepID=A0ABX2TFX9_9PROT|nr:LarC family nickel insertion protein [Azospirillum oleiclasticum]NYZ22947.1 LarC family nickel insertion protein [Azospirillum oleiclasticum]
MHIRLDAVGGIAGDMFVAALLDAFPDLRGRVLADARAALPPEAGAPVLDEAVNGGLAALRFGLGPAPCGHHHHDHGHGDHHHDHDHHHGDSGTFRAIVRRIEVATLAEGTAAHAIAILRVLAEAEARMHRVPVEDVHFHELADWDSVMDVVAAGSIIAALEGAVWSVSDLPRGGGMVRTQHGLLPVPAPATAAILTGFRWRDDGIGGERVTPTGAAILRHLIGDHGGDGAAAEGVLAAVGTGCGTRSLPDLPNVLRALVFREADAAGTETVAVLSFDIDDMTGEELGVALDRLRAADGVLDLSLGTRIGKKGRPLHDVRLLVRPDALDAVRDLCFRETATIGLRWRLERRAVLPRTAALAAVDGQCVRVKRVERPGGGGAKAESDDLAGLDGLAERRRVKRRAEEGA